MFSNTKSPLINAGFVVLALVFPPVMFIALAVALYTFFVDCSDAYDAVEKEQFDKLRDAVTTRTSTPE